MNKLTLIILVLFALPLSAQDGFDRDSYDLHAQVKSVSTVHHYPDGEIDWTMTSLVPNVQHFDKQGRLTKEEQMQQNGKSYNSYYTSYHGDSVVLRMRVHQDKDANQDILFLNQNSQIKQVYRLSETADLRNLSRDSLLAKSFGMVEFVYNKSGLLESRTSYETGKKKARFNHSYQFKYDSKKLKVEEALKGLDPNGDNIKYFKYDSKNRLISKELHRNKELESKTSYNYNSHDLVETETVTYSDNSTSSYEYKYTYDKAGNWIEKQEFRNGKISAVLRRDVGYW